MKDECKFGNKEKEMCINKPKISIKCLSTHKNTHSTKSLIFSELVKLFMQRFAPINLKK
jgi:hypothetical protein